MLYRSLPKNSVSILPNRPSGIQNRPPNNPQVGLSTPLGPAYKSRPKELREASVSAQ